MNNKSFRVLLGVAMLVLSSLACNALSFLGGGPLLEDNFDGNSSNWGTGTDADSSVEYSDGGLQMLVSTPDYFTWSTPNETEYQNVHIEVTARHNDSNSITAFGVICNEQTITESHYYFVISSDGGYAIAKAALAQSDVFLTNNDQWAHSDAIKQNADSYRIGADCGNGMLTLYVDGQEIASVSDSTYTAGGVGLITWSGSEAPSADVTFDDFVMTKLPAAQ